VDSVGSACRRTRRAWILDSENRPKEVGSWIYIGGLVRIRFGADCSALCSGATDGGLRSLYAAIQRSCCLRSAMTPSR